MTARRIAGGNTRATAASGQLATDPDVLGPSAVVVNTLVGRPARRPSSSSAVQLVGRPLPGGHRPPGSGPRNQVRLDCPTPHRGRDRDADGKLAAGGGPQRGEHPRIRRPATKTVECRIYPTLHPVVLPLPSGWVNIAAVDPQRG